MLSKAQVKAVKIKLIKKNMLYKDLAIICNCSLNSISCVLRCKGSFKPLEEKILTWLEEK